MKRSVGDFDSCASSKADDGGDRVVGARGRDAHPEDGARVDGSREDGVADILALRHALARHRRLVDLARSLDDRAVGRDAVTGAHKDGGADRKALRGHLGGLAVLSTSAVFGTRAVRPWMLARRGSPPTPPALARDEEQEHDRRRFLLSADETAPTAAIVISVSIENGCRTGPP